MGTKKIKNNTKIKIELIFLVITILFSLFGIMLIERDGNINNLITGFASFSIYPEEPANEMPEQENFGIQPIENLSVQLGNESGFGIMPNETIEFGIMAAPTHTAPLLNSTNPATNDTNQNLTCYNQSTADADNDLVKNIYNWYRNNASIMVLNMPFEGGSNATYTKDYSGFGNNGVVSGATWNSTGGYDSRGAYQFDGVNDYIDAGDAGNLNMGSRNFSIEYWIKMPSQLRATSYTIIWKRDWNGASGTNIGYYTGVYGTEGGTNAGKMYFVFGSVASSNYAAKIADITINTSTWYHVVAQRTGSGNTAEIWIDGVNRTLTDSSVGTAGNTDNTQRLLIGKRTDATQFFNGSIDEVRIYNRSLSANEIWALYANQSNVITSAETTAGDFWKCEVTPNDGTSDGSALNSSELQILSLNPTTTLVSPTNNNQTVGSLNIEFNCSATSNTYTLTNITLYGNWTETWHANQTNLVSGAYNSTIFKVNVTKGKWYLWNCLTYNNNSLSDFGDSNFTFFSNTPPTQDIPLLFSTNNATNDTTQNLTCYNQSTADADNDLVKNIYNWYRNNASIMVLNMPFEGGSNATYTKDYSGFGNNGVVSGATWNSTGGYDSRGAYSFDGVNYKVYNNLSSDLSNSGSLFLWIKPNSLNNFTNIWSYGTSSSTNNKFNLVLTHYGTVSFFITNNTSGELKSDEANFSSSLITLNQWNNLALTWNSTNLSIYLNGINYGNNAKTVTSSVSNNQITSFGAGEIAWLDRFDTNTTGYYPLSGTVNYVNNAINITTNWGSISINLPSNIQGNDFDFYFRFQEPIKDTQEGMEIMLYHPGFAADASSSSHFDRVENVGGRYRIHWGGLQKTAEVVAMTAGTWYRGKITKRGANVAFYVDDNQIGTTQSLGVDYNTSSILLENEYVTSAASMFDDLLLVTVDSNGNRDDSNFFNGTIDEVRIYNYSLSANQIKALYTNQTNLIHSDETTVGDFWKCEVTPNDGTSDGSALNSSELQILSKVAPTISLIFPENNSIVTSSSVNLTYNVTDHNSDTVDNCTLWLTAPNSNDLLNNQTDTTITQNTNQTFNLTLADGNYKYLIGCTDNQSLAANSSQYNFSVSAAVVNTAPVINIPSILPYPAYTNDTLNCSTYVYDIDLDTLSVNFTWYNSTTLYESNITSLLTNGSFVSKILTREIQAKGETWNCTVTPNDGTSDGLSQSNSTLINNSAPTIGEVTIAPSTAYTNTTLNCSATGYDIDLDTLSANFSWYNGTSLYTSATKATTNGTLASTTLTSEIQNKNEIWNCSVRFNDTSQEYSLANSTTITIQNTRPQVDLVFPANATSSINRNTTFYYNVTDIDNIIRNCTLWLSPADSIILAVNQTNRSSISLGANNTLNIPNLTVGYHLWLVSCEDDEALETNSSTRYYTIDNDYPVINLKSPDNQTTSTDSSVTFTYNISDQDVIDNCSLIVDNIIDQTDITITKDTPQTFSKTFSSNANYYWSVNCTDSLSGTNNSEIRKITINTATGTVTAPPSGFGSGSGAGGSGGTQSQISEIKKTAGSIVYSIPSLITPITIKADESLQYIISIIITPSRESSDVKIKVEEINNIPIEKPDSNIITFLRISTENLPNAVLSYATINFRVPKSEGSNIQLQHYDNGKWIKLPTNLVSEDNDFNYYESTTTSLSYFAITTSKKEMPFTFKFKPKVITESLQIVKQTIQNNYIFIIIIASLMFLIVVIRRFRKSKKPSKFKEQTKKKK